MADDNRFDQVTDIYPGGNLTRRERQFVRYDRERTKFWHELTRKLRIFLFVWLIPLGAVLYAVSKWLSANVIIK